MQILIFFQQYFVFRILDYQFPNGYWDVLPSIRILKYLLPSLVLTFHLSENFVRFDMLHEEAM